MNETGFDFADLFQSAALVVAVVLGLMVLAMPFIKRRRPSFPQNAAPTSARSATSAPAAPSAQASPRGSYTTASGSAQTRSNRAEDDRRRRDEYNRREDERRRDDDRRRQEEDDRRRRDYYDDTYDRAPATSLFRGDDRPAHNSCRRDTDYGNNDRGNDRCDSRSDDRDTGGGWGGSSNDD